ncbi:MAG: TetR/AcrR family transcriptional regulator [Chthoniobacterales bacterium]|nr:TetR/AcrR family transcriptional regulator [Chthoniobacterales bacterium]
MKTSHRSSKGTAQIATGKLGPRSRSAAGRRSPARRILEEARIHFFKHGFRNVTMDDLAAELGVSKKTLYAHYPSKDALLEAVLDAKYGSIRATLEQAAAQRAAHFPEALHALLSSLRGELDELQPAFLRDMRKAPEIFKQLEQRRARLIRHHFGRLFRQGQRDGHVRRDLSAQLMIETLLASIQAIMNPAKLCELEMAPRTAFTGLIDLLLHGAVVRRKGPR